MGEPVDIDTGLVNRLCALLHLEPRRIRLSESFIHNGGDSLLAIKFSNIIQRTEHVHVGAGAILLAKSLGSLLSKTHLQELATRKSLPPVQTNDIPITASTQNLHDHASLDPIQRIPAVIPTSGLPITFVQAGVVVMTHRVPGAAVQHMTQYCYTDLLPQLKDAFAKAMANYQVFRIKFEVETDPLLVEATWKDSIKLNWTEQSVAFLEGTDLEESFRAWTVEASSEPVFRVMTPETTSSARKLSAVHWFYHHSLMDGRSMDIFLRQVDKFLTDPSLSTNIRDTTLDVVKGLKDYHAPRAAAARAFWSTRELSGGVRNHPLLRVLGDRLSPRVRMSSIDVFFPENLKTFQSRMGFTFEVLVRAALALVLCKLQGTSTVSLMSVTSRRSLPISDIEEAVGNIATSMILTVDVNENDTAKAFLEQVFHKVIELDEMSYSDPSDGFSLGGLVVVSSDLQSHTPWYSGGHQTEVIAPKETLPSLYVSPAGRVRFAYNSGWRSPSEMRVMTDLFKHALVNLASGSLSVGDCLSNMLPPSQRQKVLEWGNCFGTRTSLEGISDDITSLFLNQVLERGDAVALRLGDETISYQGLANMIQTVGRRLRDLLDPGSVVMIHADGSINWVVAMFAVLWADCVFSPQGVNLPHQLRSHHYQIANTRAFLVPYENKDLLSPDGCQMTLFVDKMIQDAQSEGQKTYLGPPDRRPNPLSAAYICFSSGTTGQPKAISCTYAGVVAVLGDPVARLHVSPGHRVAQTLAPPFDGALLEVFSALCYGGTLILKDPKAPFRNLQMADTLLTTPSLAAELNPADYPGLKYIYLASETLPQRTADIWSAGTAMTYNIYGPTECHMVATAQRVRPGQPVTIGKPFSSTRVYILDKQGELTPPLVAGEIYIAGVQVSLGYIGLDSETAHRFVSDTVWRSDSGKMYRTGDWGYWTLDGEIAFIGRTDRQVKLGGFRIDLNDIQARLEKALPSKVRVAVVVVGDALACAISDGPLEVGSEDVKSAAERVLPPQNVPRRVKRLDVMPVSAFGKIDYRAVIRLLE